MSKICLYQILTYIKILIGFPGGSVVKRIYLQCRKPGSGRSPGGGHGTPLQYSCLENPHRQKNLAGYSARGSKETNTTERLSTHKKINTYFILLESVLRLLNLVYITVCNVSSVFDTVHHSLEEAHFKCSWAPCASASSTGQCRPRGFRKDSSTK